MTEHFDIIIIGGGPAGLTAAVYARRAGKSVLILEKATIGGQIASSPKVDNFPAMPGISGAELADRLYAQADELGARLELEEVLDSMPQAYTDMPHGSGGRPADLTALRAGEIAGLSMRIRAIEDCLKCIPEKYQDGILDKLAYGVPYPDCSHLNTWKKWQQVYLYQVALALQVY